MAYHRQTSTSIEGDFIQPSMDALADDTYTSKPTTTTISTIIIKAGENTRLVLAVLQSGDHMRIEVDHMAPPMLEVGDSYNEAVALQKQHLDLIARLQAKQANVEELLSNADSLVAEKSGTDAIVYEAMADSLGAAWKDLNRQIQLRAELLELSVEFFGWANKFDEEAGSFEHLCGDLPENIFTSDAKLRDVMNKRESAYAELLETLVDIMSYGERVIEKMQEIGHLVQNTGRIREAFDACEKVEERMIRIGERAQSLKELWELKKLGVDWSFHANLIYAKLKEIEQWVADKRERLEHEDIGDSEMSAELLKNEIQKILEETKPINELIMDLQNELQGLTVKGEAEALNLKGNLEDLLNQFEEICLEFRNRLNILNFAVRFFTSSTQASNDLNVIEQELRSTSLSKHRPRLSQRQTELVAKAHDCANPAIGLGKMLIQSVGNVVRTRGVAAKLKELEERLHYIKNLCKMCEEEDTTRALFNTQFMTKFNMLHSWLLAKQESILNLFAGFGTNSVSVENFQRFHHNLLDEFNEKEPEYDTFVHLLHDVEMKLSQEYREEAIVKFDETTRLWKRLTVAINVRLALSELYAECIHKLEKLRLEMAEKKSMIQNLSLDSIENADNFAEQTIAYMQRLVNELKSSVSQFGKAISNAGGEPMMDLSASQSCLETEIGKIWDEIDFMHRCAADVLRRLTDEQEVLTRWRNIQEELNQLMALAHGVQVEAGERFFLVDQSPMTMVTNQKDLLNELIPRMRSVRHDLGSAVSVAKSIAGSHQNDIQYKTIINKCTFAQEELGNYIGHLEVICALTITFLAHLGQIDEWIRKIEKEAHIGVLSLEEFGKMEEHLSRGRAALQTLNELWSLITREGEDIIHRSRQSTVPVEIRRRCENILTLLNARQMEIDLLQLDEAQIVKLSKIQTLCSDIRKVTRNISLIIEKIEQMNRRLESIPDTLQLSEKESAALNQDLKMLTVEKDSISSRLAKLAPVPDYVNNELMLMEGKWTLLKSQLEEYNRRRSAASGFWSIVQEIEIWVQEITEFFMHIGQETAQCTTSEQVEQLSRKFDDFSGEQSRIRESKFERLKNAARELYGKEWEHRIQRYTRQYKETISSFNLIKEKLQAVKKDLVTKEEIASFKPPVFTRPLTSKKINEGEDIELVCEVRGHPFPTITWQKDMAPIDGGRYLSSVEEERCILRILGSTTSDAGEYSCKAVNLVGSDVTAAPLFVKEIPEIVAPRFVKTFADGITEYEAVAENVTGRAASSCVVIKTESGVKEQKYLEETFQEAICPPVVTIHPKCVSVEEGSSVELLCEIISGMEPQVIWYKDDQPLSETREIKLRHQGKYHVVKIPFTSLSAGGLYKCVAKNAAGEGSASTQITVQARGRKVEVVYQPPTFLQKIKNQVVVEGNRLMFEVKVAGTPPIEISWFWNNVPISTTQDIHIIQEEDGWHRLVFENVSKANAGIYEVVARNAYGQASSQATLEVNARQPFFQSTTTMLSTQDIETLVSTEHTGSAPVIVNPLRNVTAPAGSTIRFECTISGSPKPNVEWTLNAQRLVQSDSCAIFERNGHHSINITSFKPEQAGIVEVVAHNAYGSASSSANLQDSGGLKVYDALARGDTYAERTGLVQPPHFIQRVESQVVCEQDEVRFEGIITGTPDIKIEWLKDGQLIRGADIKVSFVNGKATLCIDKAEIRDSGKYSCRAQNAGGIAVSSAVLTVTTPSTPPDFIIPLTSQELCEGEELRWKVHVSGTPQPTVKWYRNGEEIKSCPDFQLLEEGNGVYVLFVPHLQLEDTGTFTLATENCAGEARSTADLIIKKPDDPSRVIGCTTRIFEESVQLDMSMSGYMGDHVLVGSTYS